MPFENREVRFIGFKSEFGWRIEEFVGVGFGDNGKHFGLFLHVAVIR